MKLLVSLATTGILIMGCNTPSMQPASPGAADLRQSIERFAPVLITADTARLSAADREVLAKLIEAARILDTLYLIQSWSGNLETMKRLEADTSPEGRERLHYFHLNMGPWSLLDENKPFVPGVPPAKPAGANLYPEDMTKDEFNAWVSRLPEGEQKKATGFFYVIRRDSKRALAAVPYADEYRPLLQRASTLLTDASTAATNRSLKAFLEKRARAFLSNDYYESDVAWMDLDSPIEPTIGPYEVYLDELFNYKAAFEAYIGLRNDEETANLAKFSKYLQEIENNLPIEARFKNPRLGALAPIRVIDQVAVGGESRAGVQTAAFNLPNDERVTTEKGSKRVMLRNVQQAKFEKTLKPIASLTIDARQQHLIAFEPFFTHTLAHELMHGLGPHNIVVGGKPTTVRQTMKELGSAIEEAKADVSGLFALQYLIDRGIVPKETEQQMYVTFLASSFRSLRFGITEAHGRGMALQLNYFIDKGAFVYDEKTGTFSVNFERVKETCRALTGEIMTMQGQGDYETARQVLERLTTITPPVRRTLDKLKSIPVDIEPVSSNEAR
jgi:hypothetical protein